MESAVTQLALFPDHDEPDSMSGFSVRESGRAKRLSIKVFPRGRVEVVVPKRTRAAEVREFVESAFRMSVRIGPQARSQVVVGPFTIPASARRWISWRRIMSPGAFRGPAETDGDSRIDDAISSIGRPRSKTDLI